MCVCPTQTQPALTAQRGEAERAWGKAQPEDALYKAAGYGDLAACTRLLGAGTHPVGWKVSEPKWLPSAATAPRSSWQVFQSDIQPIEDKRPHFITQP